MSMNNTLQVRLSDGLHNYVKRHADEMDFTPSAFIRYLIIKDKESVGDEREFWKDAVDNQISDLKARIDELQQVKDELETAD